MATDSLYCSEITNEEQDLGFEVKETANPQGKFAYAPPKVSAVVFSLTNTDRVIKVNNPVHGRPTYHLQRFGTYAGQKPEQAKWHSISDTAYPSPQMAILAHQNDIPAAVAHQSSYPQPEIIPCDPGERY